MATEIELLKGRKESEYQTTLKNFNFDTTHIRRNGNSTRQINDAIEILFSGKTCICLDHADCGERKAMNLYLLFRVRDRMRLEHPNTNLKIDEKTFTIKIIK